MPKAVEAARRAVALDPALAEAHSALAHTSLCTWDRAEAEREFARAVQLNPKDIQNLALYAFGYLQISEGRLKEGMEQAKLALASDPLSGYAHSQYALRFCRCTTRLWLRSFQRGASRLLRTRTARVTTWLPN